MSTRRKVVTAAGAALLLFLLAGVAAPFFNADRFRNRIKLALEQGLGRQVDLKGRIRYTLLTGPGFTIDEFVIHEDPSIGAEPLIYGGTLTAHIRLWSLWSRKVDFSSIKIEDASLNIVKTGPASDPGRWNFEPLISRSLLSSFPEIHLRASRINLKFGDAKSVFYVLNTDLDVAPPTRGSSHWNIAFTGEPARTDRPARGFSSITARGRWYQDKGGHADLDIRLEKSVIGEIIALVHGHHPGVHGEVSGRLHVAGPLHDLNLKGRLDIADIHRWDLTPTRDGGFSFWLNGRWNIPGQQFEILGSSAQQNSPPLSLHFRAVNYLGQPHWGVSGNWNRFPVEPIVEIARHMGLTVPAKLKLGGFFDGAVGYDGSDIQGSLAFHDGSLTIPDSPALRFDTAQVLFGQHHIHVPPAIVKTNEENRAEVEADYDLNTAASEIKISATNMDLAALRAQVALAAVPGLERIVEGRWTGTLAFNGQWSGKVLLENAVVPLDGLSDAVRVEKANILIDGPNLEVDHIRAEAGNVTAQGDYGYEADAARPHRFRLVLGEVSAADLEKLLLPSLRRDRSLLARALGRRSLPDWLRERFAEGTLQIARFRTGDWDLEKVRGRVVWDAARIEVQDLQAQAHGGTLNGRVTIGLRDAAPSYRVQTRIRSMEWNAGRVDATFTASASGFGRTLLRRIQSQGTFTAHNLEFTGTPVRLFSGAYSSNGERWSLSDLQLSTGSETFNGRGSMALDGKVQLQLSSASREVKFSGPIAQLKLDEPAQ